MAPVEADRGEISRRQHTKDLGRAAPRAPRKQVPHSGDGDVRARPGPAGESRTRSIWPHSGETRSSSICTTASSSVAISETYLTSEARSICPIFGQMLHPGSLTAWLLLPSPTMTRVQKSHGAKRSCRSKLRCETKEGPGWRLDPHVQPMDGQLVRAYCGRS